MSGRLLLLLTFLYEASGAFFSIHPGTSAAGMLPRFYRVTLELDNVANPAGAVNGAAGAIYTINFGSLTSLRGPLPVGYDSWVPFIRGLGQVAATPAFVTAGAQPLIGEMYLNAYQMAGPSTCTGIVVWTSADGKTLGLGDMNMVAAAATAPCLLADVMWEFQIPALYLASNPPFPEVLVSYSLSFTTAAAATFTYDVSVPWATKGTETIARALHFHRVVPDTTIAGTTLNSLAVSFTPGSQMVGGEFITLLVRPQAGTMQGAAVYNGIFNVIAGRTNLPVVPIGVDGCASAPSDIYCCSQTVVSQPGYAAQAGAEMLRFQLLPLGCALPAGKVASFTIPSNYLSRNPTLVITTLPTPAAFQAFQLAVVLNAILITSEETAGTYEGRLGRPIVDPTQPQINGVDDLDGHPLRQAVVPATSAGVNYFTSWSVGLTMVSGFTAVPETLSATVTPANIVLSWVLTTPLTVPAAVAANIPHRFVITSNPGVFRRNIGTEQTQKLVVTMVPSQCGAATYYTDEYGTLIFTPNPLNTATCTDQLTAAARITITLSSEALLPNPAGNQQVRFDIRGIPLMTNAAAGGWYSAADTATLKDVLGYVTTTDCNTAAVPSFTFSSPTDLATLPYNDRANLVAKITSLSTGGAAIKQCPIGAGTVTWTKFPEGSWRASSWPLNNVAALGDWAQVVGSTPTIAMQNWGHMVTYPMYAVTVTYPPQSSTLLSLGVSDSIPAGWRLAFIIRNDRLTLSGAVASILNPWQFVVSTSDPIVAVRHIGSSNAVRAAGSVSSLESLSGALWAQRANQLAVTVPQSGLVYGFASANPSPIPNDGSDDALFGLLALIAVPVLLCCCLLALLWFLRPKAEACPCVPEYPVQEMYWVNAQPCAPTFSVAQCGPSTTPVYLVQ